jgi:hypothetical protein
MPHRQPDVIEVTSHTSPALGEGHTGSNAEAERAVEYIVDECFFAMGQAIGMRTTVDYDAVIFMRDHYRAKFLAAMKVFGNRWAQDRENVTSVALMFGERAVRHAGDRSSIDLESVRKAAADVQRYCKLHSRRAARSGDASSEGAQSRIAGYWCTDDEP